MKSAKQTPDLQFEDSPTAWFVVLEAARVRGDFEKAATAQKELARLGVKVRFCKQNYHRTNQEAAHAAN
ncbi:MAG TPA: hypothetical protein VGG19_20680 [Tepidisphaeraceae bacterium]|jgi:hypothetical protein